MNTLLIMKAQKNGESRTFIRFLVREMGNKATEWLTKEDIVRRIKAERDTFYTEPSDGFGGTEFGKRVHVVSVGDEDYLRLDSKSLAQDALGNLPER